MKSKLATFAIMFVAVFTLAACLNDDNEYVYTDDSAITSFSVTGAKRYIHTKTQKGDKDSVYTTTSSYSSYYFSIDQNSNTIYNTDSLPCGIDATKLVCTITGLNSATVGIKNLDNDNVVIASSVDSLDFSQPRELQVMSNSGKFLRKYTVTVNVHKEQADSFFWTKVSRSDEIKRFTAVRTCAVKTQQGSTRLFLFGTDGTNTAVYVMNDGKTWVAATPNFNGNLASDAYKGIVTKDNMVYVSFGGNIMRTADGNTWEQTGSNTGIVKLIAASPLRIYGLDADNKILASADNGNTWTATSLDSDGALLPTTESTYTCAPLRTNDNAYRVTVYGKTAAGDMAVWGKIDEGNQYSENQEWAYYDVSADNKHVLPKLNNMTAVDYDGKVYALGTTEGTTDNTTALYVTEDGGLTWAADTVLTLPSEMNISLEAEPSANRQAALTVDDNNFLWIVNARNGITWRGRINRLGWKKEQYDFSE